MTVINTRKLRKIGNSKVLTIPEEVIQTLNVNEGQVLLEAVKTDNKENVYVINK